MPHLQLWLAMGLPTFMVLAGILLNRSEFQPLRTGGSEAAIISSQNRTHSLVAIRAS